MPDNMELTSTNWGPQVILVLILIPWLNVFSLSTGEGLPYGDVKLSANHNLVEMNDVDRSLPGVWLMDQRAHKSKSGPRQDLGCFNSANDQVLCQGSSVTSVPNGYRRKTKTFVFYQTGLTELTAGVFYNYPNLDTIVIVDSPMSRVEAGAFRGISNLKWLQVSENHGRDIKFENQPYDGVSSLEKLELINVNIRAMPKFLLKEATSLRIMHLGVNLISEFDGELLSTLDALDELDLSSNELSNIETSAFKHMPNISMLFLQNNLVGAFPMVGVSQLKNLSQLDLSYNKFTDFNRTVCDSSTTLTYLNLEGNSLVESALNESFTGCTSIETLDLSNNGIDNLPPGTFINMTGLMDLRIGNNNFQTLPSDVLENIPTLKALNISGNNITKISENDLAPLKDLRELYAQSMWNGLEIEKGAFKGNLQILDLSGNPGLNVTTETLLGPTDIQNISLANCSITALKGALILKKNSLMVLDISDNPLICDCRAAWMADSTKPWAQDWVNQSSVTPAPECGTPTWYPYSSVYITHFSVDDLTCDKPTIKPLTPTNVTLHAGQTTFNMQADLMKGLPYSTWILPDGQRVRVRSGAPALQDLGHSVTDDVNLKEHHVQTTCTISSFDYMDPVNFTLMASNMAGDTRITFWVYPGPPTKPPHGASHSPVLDVLSLIFVIISTLLLRD